MNYKILHWINISYNIYNSVNLRDIVQISEYFEWYKVLGELYKRARVFEREASCLHLAVRPRFQRISLKGYGQYGTRTPWPKGWIVSSEFKL